MEPSVLITEETLRNIAALDFDAAVLHCGSFDALKDTLKIYYDTLPANADRIEALWQEGDLRGYTVAVHALKSSSRLIGAMTLSADALAMENAGNAEDTALLAEKTPALLADYRALGDALSVLFPKQDADALPEISREDLLSLVKTMRQAAEDFDLDALDEAAETLERYRFPAEQADAVSRVRSCVAAADWGALEEALDRLDAG